MGEQVNSGAQQVSCFCPLENNPPTNPDSIPCAPLAAVSWRWIWQKEVLLELQHGAERAHRQGAERAHGPSSAHHLDCASCALHNGALICRDGADEQMGDGPVWQGRALNKRRVGALLHSLVAAAWKRGEARIMHGAAWQRRGPGAGRNQGAWMEDAVKQRN
jgi:hypothetical protein